MEQKPRKVAALYTRVSTLDQNCEVQLEDLRRYAGKRFASFCEYTDAGVSGTAFIADIVSSILEAVGTPFLKEMDGQEQKKLSRLGLPK